MAGSVNKVIIVGHLGNDPEVRALDGGVNLARISVATTESYTDKNTGQKISNTEWHRVTMWRGLATVAEKYLKKGSLVYIEGKLRTRSWEDENKQTRYSTEIVADNMTMLGGRNDGQNPNPAASGSAPTNTPATPPTPKGGTDLSSDDTEDVLPF